MEGACRTPGLPKALDVSKLSTAVQHRHHALPRHCAALPTQQARQTFSVSFYLVSIMYLLFDIEICYLFPYVMCHANAQVGVRAGADG